MDYNHIGVICPKCQFENDIEGATYCRKCSTPLGNHCTNEECDYFYNFELPIDSLYCHECQAKSILYDVLVSEENQTENHI